MNAQLLITFQDMVHTASIIVLGIAAVILLISILKPYAFKKLMHEFGERKYVVSACLFTGLLCGTVFIATRPNADNAFVSENTKNTPVPVDLLQQPNNAQTQQIEIKDVVVVEPIPYSKEEQTDNSMATDHIKLLQAGKDGQKTLVYSVTYDNGRETSRSLKSESVTREPVTEITAAGTKVSADKAKSEGSKFPKIELTCKKEDDSKSNDNRPRVCLYKS